ncbi:MAG: cupredoxin domain-containing protein [Anaerolineales bacterium]|jgi:heme/copper-type cytochrome/quinol oxidase subunit 2|nr:cupredoxin domain-containing protein [Anaerolineales bacterium]
MTTLESGIPAPNQSLKWLFTGLIIGTLLAILFLIASRTLSTHPGTITLKTSGLQFSETELHVKVGQTVNLELFNTDGYAHAFDIDVLGIHVPLPGSQTTTLTFTPTQPGVYEFYCGAYGHKGAGMVGTLIVEP